LDTHPGEDWERGYCNNKSQGSSVSIVTGHGRDDRGIGMPLRSDDDVLDNYYL
jgi:hypothetical protein